MNTISTESSKASVPDHARPQAEIDECAGASTSEDACNDREALQDDYNGCAPSRSRYGRTIKPRVSNAVDFPQNWKPKTRRQLSNSIDNSTDESIEEINISNNIDEASDSSIVMDIKEETSSPKEVGPNIECLWIVGQLAWARVGNFPFWPCMVTVDPTSRIYYKLRVTNRISMMVHVHYFGDRGRHSWVSANCMMEFKSYADFLKLAESLTAETKKKDAKYAAAFVVKPGTKKKWENAVREAEETQPLTIEERIAIFAVKVKVSRSKGAKSVNDDEKNKNKRKRSRLSMETEQDGPDVKRIKQDNVILIIALI